MDRRTPLKTKLSIAVLGLVYIVSPLDILPDILPLLGLTDDMVILPIIMWMLLPQNVLEEARQYIENRSITKSNKRYWFWWALLIFCVVLILFVLFKYLGFDLGDEPSIIAKNF